MFSVSCFATGCGVFWHRAETHTYPSTTKSRSGTVKLRRQVVRLSVLPAASAGVTVAQLADIAAFIAVEEESWLVSEEDRARPADP